MAPCHFLSEPWRFYTAGPETKAKLCALNEDKKAMFEGVPEWLIVTMCSEHEEGSKLYYEDHAAVSCATQNFMLSLASEGFGSKWMTGALGISGDKMFSEVLGIDMGTEHYMGTILMGKPLVPVSQMKVPRSKKGTGEPIFTTFK